MITITITVDEEKGFLCKAEPKDPTTYEIYFGNLILMACGIVPLPPGKCIERQQLIEKEVKFENPSL